MKGRSLARKGVHACFGWLTRMASSQGASLTELEQLCHSQTCCPHHSSGFGFFLLRVSCLAGMLG